MKALFISLLLVGILVITVHGKPPKGKGKGFGLRPHRPGNGLGRNRTRQTFLEKFLEKHPDLLEVISEDCSDVCPPPSGNKTAALECVSCVLEETGSPAVAEFLSAVASVRSSRGCNRKSLHTRERRQEKASEESASDDSGSEDSESKVSTSESESEESESETEKSEASASESESKSESETEESSVDMSKRSAGKSRGKSNKSKTAETPADDDEASGEEETSRSEKSKSGKSKSDSSESEDTGSGNELEVSASVSIKGRKSKGPISENTPRNKASKDSRSKSGSSETEDTGSGSEDEQEESVSNKGRKRKGPRGRRPRRAVDEPEEGSGDEDLDDQLFDLFSALIGRCSRPCSNLGSCRRLFFRCGRCIARELKSDTIEATVDLLKIMESQM